MADIEKKEKLTSEHIFRIASHSKTFTATAIMQLQEQGKLKIDDHVVNYVPWLKDHKDSRFSQITIRQLLSHGAGVIRDGLDSNYWQLGRPFPDAAQFKAEMLAADLVIDNNTKLKYSNYGYSLLGCVIEAVSGVTYHDFVVQYIVKPLGLKNTGPEYAANIKDQIVTGYSRPDLPDKRRLAFVQIDTRAMAAATGFYATSEDICTYFTAQIVGSGKLLSDESKNEMQRMQWQAEYVAEKQEYGLGLRIDHIKHRYLIGHGGGFPGQITTTLCDPKDQLVVTVLTNCLDSGARKIAQSIISLMDYFQNHWAMPQDKFDRFEGRFMELFSVVDVIASGKKLFAGSSESWQLFDHPDELEHVQDNTFKIVKTNSFASEGELVHFKLDSGGKVKSVMWAGELCLPEKDYLTQIAKRTKIDIKPHSK
ncbi:MAG: serine hydrolase [Candidatus Saccharimonadales bacterium]